eukprot:5226-Eustigmatos_ZCMA.PRE.1
MHRGRDRTDGAFIGILRQVRIRSLLGRGTLTLTASPLLCSYRMTVASTCNGHNLLTWLYRRSPRPDRHAEKVAEEIRRGRRD